MTEQQFIDRFWSRVTITPDCWLWTGATSANGYGHISVNRQTRSTHRLAWEAANGPIPDGMEIDHVCRVRHCVNPSHMRIVTRKQNAENRSPWTKSGFRNVYYVKSLGLYRVCVHHNGRDYYGGQHTSPELADLAARQLRDRLFTHHLDGVAS